MLGVDVSEPTVTSGQTKPLEVSKLLRKGVEVHSVENLHAHMDVQDGRRGPATTACGRYTGLRETTLDAARPAFAAAEASVMRCCVQ